MENFDDYFKTLGEINHVERELKCCELKENFEYTNKGETVCKICNNTISNIKASIMDAAFLVIERSII